MKVLAFNGSPRKTWNTATLLEQALREPPPGAPKPNSSISTISILKAASAVSNVKPSAAQATAGVPSRMV